MKQILKSSVFVLSTLLASSGFAAEGSEEHGMSTIAGTSVELKTRDHAFAGSIGDWLAFGHFKHDGFVSNLTLLKGEHRIEAEFGEKDGGIGGSIVRTENGVVHETKIRFMKASKTAPQLVFDLNGQALEVTIVPDDFQNNHFINPTYTATIGAQTHSFTLKGEACYGYSSHLIMMIFGTLAHIQP